MSSKKSEILDQVGQLYLRYGIRSVTMDDVSRELCISKKTLYQLFNDKEELVHEVVNACFIENPNLRIADIDGSNAIDRIVKTRERMVKVLHLIQNKLDYDLRKFYPQVYKEITAFKRKMIYEDNFSVLEQGKNEGLFRKDIDSDFISRIAVGRFLLILNPDNEIFTEEEIRDIKLFDEVIDYHFHGICTEKGLKYYKQQLNNVQNEN